MDVLKNYVLLKDGGYEEYPAIEIRYNDNVVFADLPLCAIPYGSIYDHPVIVSVSQRGIARVADREPLIAQLTEKTQKVYFELDSDENPVIVNKETKLYMRLPKEEDPNKYIYDYRNGQVFVIDIIKKAEEK